MAIAKEEIRIVSSIRPVGRYARSFRAPAIRCRANGLAQPQLFGWFENLVGVAARSC
jgi:hypothetical protein